MLARVMANRLVLYAAFAASGVAALLYEITWTRLLTLFLGHTVAAVSTVLAAFMGGLAAGAAVAGRVAPALSPAAALRMYAGIEVFVAVCGVAMPFALGALEPMLARAYDDGRGGWWFGAVRLFCALVAVTVPAAAMGATLPIVVRGGVAETHGTVGGAGRLYAVNTSGAAVGAGLAGFVLLPALGMGLTAAVAAGLNLLAAMAAWRLATRSPIVMPPERRRPVPTSSQRRRDATASSPPMRVASARLRRLTLVAVAVSGAAAIIQQIAWTRIVALAMGPTTFAFSAVVAIFIGGLALGAFAGAWLAGRTTSVAPLVAALCGAGVLALIVLGGVPWAVIRVAEAVAAPGATFATLVRSHALLLAMTLLPLTLAFGAVFPLALGVAAVRHSSIGANVAAVFVANTAGALAGAMAAGFWLVPALGLQGTVRASAIAMLAAGALIALGAERRVRLAVEVAALAVAALIVWRLAAWDPALISSGGYKYAAYVPPELRGPMLRAGTLLYYREGAASTVSVRRTAGVTTLSIDGKVDASNAGDMLTQRLLAHVPLLLHEQPRRVGIIGLGSGVTLASALRHPIERADVVEISREVVDASSYFARENRGALQDPRTRLVLGDGRTHIALGREPYDVLISEPSNPWIAGVAALFTREFFAAASRRLSPGGLMCQWAHTYDISDADLRSIVATFSSVFAHSTLWIVGDGDVLLLGSAEPIEPRLPAIGRNWSRASVAEDLLDVDVSGPEVLVSLAVGRTASLSRYAAGAEIQRDDRLQLEFSGPRGLYGNSSSGTGTILRRAVSEPPLSADGRPPHDRAAQATARGAMLVRAEAHGDAFGEFVSALGLDPRSDPAARGLIRSAAQTGRLDEAERVLRAIRRADPGSVEVALALSQLHASRGDFVLATEPLRAESTRDRPDVRVLEQLASVAADAADQLALGAMVGRLDTAAPGGSAALYYGATLHAIEGRLDESLRSAEALSRTGRCHARCQNLLGALYDAVGRKPEARAAFLAAIAADPRDVTAYTNLARFELTAGNIAAARSLFAEALVLDPSSPPARQGLAEAIRQCRVLGAGC